MKARYRLHPERKFVDVTFEGPVTLSDLGALIESVWRDSEWTPEFNGLLDFSAASLEFSEQDILGLTRMMRTDPRCSMGTWVFVVSRAADFGKLRKIDHDEQKATIRVYFDRKSAEKGAGL